MAKDLNTSKLNEVGMYGEEPFVGYEVTRPSEVLPAGIESTVIGGVFAVSGDMAAIASIGCEIKLPESPKARETFLRKWAEKAAEKAKANKSLSTTLLILPLAACGGTDVSLFRADLTVAQATEQFASLQANGYSIKDSAADIINAGSNVLAGATQVALASNAAITVTDSNALAALTNFVGFNGTVTLSDHGSITVAPSVDTYVLSNSGANTITVPASNLDVNITGGTDADTVNVGGLAASGTYALGGGTDVITIGNGGNISGVNAGAATTAEVIVLDADGKGTGLGSDVTMTVAQHEAFSTVTAGGSADQVTVTTSGAITADDDVETYVFEDDTLTNNITVASSAAGRSVDVTSGASNTTTVTINGLTVDGTYTLGGSADTIVATDGADITDVNTGGDTEAETLDLTGGITMTQAQHEAFGDIDATGSSDQVTVTTSGAITADDDVETYVFENDTLTNNITVASSAAGRSVDVTSGASNTTTVTINGLTVDGTYTLGGSADTIVATDGADITDVNTGGDTEAETLDLTGGITMTQAQHQAFSSITGNGTNDVTITTSGTVDAVAGIETYVLSGGTNTINLASATRETNVTADSADNTTVTVNLAGNSDHVFFNGDFALLGTGIFNTSSNASLYQINDGAELTAGTLNVNGGLTWLTVAQHEASGLTINGTTSNDTILVSSSGEFTGVATIENYILYSGTDGKILTTNTPSVFTLGSLTQNVSAGFGAGDTVVFDIADSDGQYEGRVQTKSTGTIRIDDDADISLVKNDSNVTGGTITANTLVLAGGCPGKC